jgi:GT2 family glycosyltransferase
LTADLPPSATKIAGFELVVVSYRSRVQLEKMLAPLPLEQPVVIVDNAAGVDRVGELMESRPAGRCLDGGGHGFAKAANLAARTSTADILVFGNPDSRPRPEVLDEIVAEVARSPDVGSCAAATVDARGRIQIGVGGWEPTVRRAAIFAVGLHRVFPRAGLYARPKVAEPIDLDWLTGACLAVRRETFLRVGGFDERYFVYNEDMAFGRQLREAGLRQRLRTDLLVPHAGGSSGAGTKGMFRMRGASMAAYLHHHNDVPRAVVMRALLGAGMLARAIQCVLQGRPQTARLHVAYVFGIVRGHAPIPT